MCSSKTITVWYINVLTRSTHILYYISMTMHTQRENQVNTSNGVDCRLPRKRITIYVVLSINFVTSNLLVRKKKGNN